MKTRMGWQVYVFAASCLFLIGAPTFIIARQLFWRFGYVEVRAQVIASEVKTYYNRQNRLRFAPSIRYRYERNGRTFECSRFRTSGSGSARREDAVALLAAYPPGSYVDAFVNPLAPSNAWLERRLELWPFALLLLEVSAVWALLRALAKEGARQRLARSGQRGDVEPSREVPPN